MQRAYLTYKAFAVFAYSAGLAPCLCALPHKALMLGDPSIECPELARVFSLDRSEACPKREIRAGVRAVRESALCRSRS